MDAMKLNQQFSTLCSHCTIPLDFSKLAPLLDQTWDESTKRRGLLDEVLTLHEYEYATAELKWKLTAGREEGCELCTFLSSQLKDILHESYKFSLSRWQLTRLKGDLARRLRIAFISESIIEADQAKSFDIRISSGKFSYPLSSENPKIISLHSKDDFEQAEKVGIQREIDTDMASKTNFNLARHWLNECLTFHSTCAVSKENQPLPTRLLDIGTLGRPRLKLIHTANEKVDNYVCLSYCWGKALFTKLTLAQLSAMSNSIDFDTLPTTFKDAIFVTRTLNIRYLWVDALCIIQDFNDDMKEELAKMVDIYKNSYLTIIAASAANATDGFLQPRPIPDILLRIPLDINNEDAGTILLRPSYAFERIDSGSDSTETRAWCLQEGILSPRCLVYSSLHLYWCCQELPYARCDKSYKNSSFDHLNHSQGKLPAVFRSGRRCDSLTGSDLKELYSFWQLVVKQFSGRHLAHISDKFRAFSAIAHEFQTIKGDVYMAGHWLNDLPRSLLWKSQQLPRQWESQMLPSGLKKQQLEYKNAFSIAPQDWVAPSWSWMSSSSKVTLDSYLKFAPEFKVIDVKVELKDPDEPLGNVKSGVLTIQGRLVSVLLWLDRGNARLQKDLPDGSRDLTPATAALDSSRNERDGKNWAESARRDETKLWALEVRVSEFKGFHTIEGLILAETAEENVLTRVGVFNMSYQAYNRIAWFDEEVPRVLKII